jgi:hypothetical protein
LRSLSCWRYERVHGSIRIAFLGQNAAHANARRPSVIPGRTRHEIAEGSAWNQYFRFFLVNLAALVQVWLISVGLAEWLFPAIGWRFRPELVAHTSIRSRRAWAA